jgi:hypothetical protein
MLSLIIVLMVGSILGVIYDRHVSEDEQWKIAKSLTPAFALFCLWVVSKLLS